MADNHFDLVMVWDNLGGAVRINRGGKATVTDPVTGNPVSVVENGQTVTTVTADSNGRVSFVAQQGVVKLTSGGLSMTVVSPEQADAGATNAAVAQQAAVDAQTAADSVNFKLDQLPTPYTIAHNGTSDVYVGHTPEAYRYAWNAGLRVLDIDAQVLADGQLANIHDTTVDGITTATGNVNTFSAMDFPALTVDAANIMGAAGYPNSRTMLISELIKDYGNRAIYSIEAKDGTTATVQKIVDLATALGCKDQVVVQCTVLGSLSPAVAAGMKTLHVTNSPDPASITAAGVSGACILSTDTASITSCVNAGLLTWVYGVHRRTEHAQMVALGVDGIMSDNPVYSSTTTALTTRDLFIRQVWLAGHVTSVNGRGTMTATGELQFVAGQNASALAGFLCPVPNPSGTYTINFTVTFDALGSGSSYGGLHICEPDDTAFKNNIGGGGYTSGYTVQLQPNGTLQIVKTTAGLTTTTSLGAVGVAVPTVGTGVAIQVQVTPTQITASIPAQSKSVVAADSSYRGGYIHMLQNGLASATQTRLSNISVA